ncbi:bacteriocin (plasmid) [Enterobacter asburiae]|uniref:bacteriocin n=1 Tax=Enterobacter asburiae TaxID=61645 RepID=UPI0032AE8A3E
MRNNHKAVLNEILSDEELSQISGGAGSGDWGTGAQAVWGAGVAAVTGKSCALPGNFYDNPSLSGSGLCVMYPDVDWTWVKRMTEGSSSGAI